MTTGKSDSEDEIVANDGDVAERSATRTLEEHEDRDGEEHEINIRLVSAILLGDALHNFADGIFIGVAFLLCDDALAFSILASTIYHELAQEVSDFFLLTEHAHLPPLKALVFNFVSGLSVTLGGVLVLAFEISNFTIGVILSMSAGIYICIAAKECMPIVDQLAVNTKDRLCAFFFFAFGAIPIGLVLLNHHHCEV